MSTLQQLIAAKFLEKLKESKQFNLSKIEQVAKLLADSKKLKADDLAKVFSQPIIEDIK